MKGREQVSKRNVALQQIVHIFRLTGSAPFTASRPEMSRQLSLSATLSALAMVLFALVVRADGDGKMPVGAGQAPLAAEISLG